jgi:WD40 repeat protein
MVKLWWLGSRSTVDIGIWNVKTGALLAVHNLPRDRTISYKEVETCPDQSIVFLEREDHTVEVWNFQTQIQLCCFQGFPRPHSGYIIDRSQSVILSSRYFPHKDLNVWDARSGHLLHSLQMPHATTRQWLAVSPDGQRAFCGSEGTRSYLCLITAWDLQTGQECYRLTPTRKKSIYIDWGANEGNTIEHGVCAMLTSRDGRQLINALYEGIIQIWDLQTGTFLRRFPVPKGEYNSDYYLSSIVIALTPDDRTLFCVRFNYQHRYYFMLDIETGETIAQHHSQSSGKGFSFLAFSENGQSIVMHQPTHTCPPNSELPSASIYVDLSVWNWRSKQPPSPLMLEAIYP